MTLTYIRPDADDTDGTWTNESDSNSNLFASIDETSANDSDYIKSAHLPDHDICKIRLSDPSGMVMRPATVHYRFKKRGEASTQINLDVSLLQGATEIAKWSEADIGTSYVDGSQALDVTQFNSISDFTNLYLQFDAFSTWWLAGSSVDLDFDSGLYYDSSYATATDSAHLLLHMDGADASTTFIDATGRHQVAVVGNTQIDTAQSKFGGASALFDGTGDYLTLDGSSDFAFGTGDFTIDFWVRFNGAPSTNQVLYVSATSGGTKTNCIQIFYWTVSSSIAVAVSGSVQIQGTTNPSSATWYHIAVARSGSSTKLFVNGVQEGSTYSDSTNYINAGGPFIAGDYDGTNTLNGWLDEYRILKGTAAWTTTFTPPTAPYNVALSGPYAHLSCSRASIGYAQTVAGTLTQFAANALRITDKGLLVENARTNVVLWDQDLTNAAWTKTNITAALDQTGPDGLANSASSITATAGNGTVLQTVTLASSARYQSTWIKRITGSGTINMTMDNGSTWTAVTVTGSWTLVEIPTQTLANPTVGFRIVTNGDAVAVDFVQNENGTFASSPIPTTSAAATRAADLINIIGTAKTIINGTTKSVVASMGGIVSPIAASNYWRIISDAVNNETVLMAMFNSQANQLFSGSDGLVNLLATAGSGDLFSPFKGGFSQQNTVGRSIVMNSGTVATDANSATISGNVYLGTNANTDGGGYWNGYFRRITIWNSRLADATLQGFTNP